MLLKGYLTVEEVAKQLGLSEYRVRELIREKRSGLQRLVSGESSRKI